MDHFNENDRTFMARALRLAARGRGRVSPNPMVGAVVVRGGRIVGEGWHRRYGGPHAEIEALKKAGAAARGATLYVTLEPCAHFGKTPPCTAPILEAGISRVVAAHLDPNPHVKGGGGRLLARRGVRFQSGLLETEARALNAAYLHWARTGRPLVTLKVASSLDGGLATGNGDSKWITGPAARREAHRLRAEHDAVVVGGATVDADDPELTVRHVRGVSPARMVIDSRSSTSPKAKWIRGDGARRILVTTRAATKRARAFAAQGVDVWTVPSSRSGGIDLQLFLDHAAREGFLSLLVEGGGRLAGAFLAAGLVDRVRIFTAPLLLGEDARSWTRGLNVNRIVEAPRLRNVRLKRFGDDWQIAGDLEAACLPES